MQQARACRHATAPTGVLPLLAQYTRRPSVFAGMPPRTAPPLQTRFYCQQRPPAPTLYTTVAQSEARRWPSASERITVALLWLPVLPPWPASAQGRHEPLEMEQPARMRCTGATALRAPAGPPRPLLAAAWSRPTAPPHPLLAASWSALTESRASCATEQRRTAGTSAALTDQQGHEVRQLHVGTQHLLERLHHHRRQNQAHEEERQPARGASDTVGATNRGGGRRKKYSGSEGQRSAGSPSKCSCFICERQWSRQQSLRRRGPFAAPGRAGQRARERAQRAERVRAGHSRHAATSPAPSRAHKVTDRVVAAGGAASRAARLLGWARTAGGLRRLELRCGSWAAPAPLQRDGSSNWRCTPRRLTSSSLLTPGRQIPRPRRKKA